MTIKNLPIKPGIRNEVTGEVLTNLEYRKRRDLDALFGSTQYKLTIKQINKQHYDLIESKWGK